MTRRPLRLRKAPLSSAAAVGRPDMVPRELIRNQRVIGPHRNLG